MDLSRRPFQLEGDAGDRYTCDALIIATGASARYLGLPSEERFHGRGVSACATCDGFFFKGHRVAVIGGGNTAVEEALYLSHLASHVTLIHRRERLRAEKIMQDRLHEREREGKVTLLWHHRVEEILGDDAGVNAVRVRSTVTDAAQDIGVSGVFVAIGHTPNTHLFEGQLAMRGGYLLVRGGLAGRCHGHQRAGRVCRRGRGRSRLPPGRHLRGHRLHGRARCGSLSRAVRPRGTARIGQHRLGVTSPLQLRVLDRISEVPAQQWNALVGGYPFLQHAFLSALEHSGCASAHTGWTPQHLALFDAQGLAAAAPLYRKEHSWGEFVFDFAWARAAEQRGLPYYPKLVCAVPFRRPPARAC